MLCFPNCKINLGLQILRKREDGYHDLETVFYPLPFTDALEIIRHPGQEISFTTSGLPIAGKEEDNLCIKAWRLLKQDLPALPGIALHLHKAIPMGAGLGGGSSDGAFALKLINDTFNLGLSTEALLNYAALLGSDAPFFILNKPAFAQGRGEILEPVDLDLSRYYFLLANPGIHVHTGRAFSQLTPAVPVKSIRDIILQPLSTWKEELVNDFEGPVMEQYPALKKIKTQLYRDGAAYAAMSGSGSTLFGIFENKPAEDPYRTEGYFTHLIHPLPQ